MRKAAVVLFSVLALVLGLSVSAGAATKPAYKVTLRTSVASSVADRFITVGGKVTGPKAAGHSVVIQRRYLGASWVTVATATVKPNGTYLARVETPRGGTTSFRALKARSSVRRAGTSNVRAIPVYRWIALASQNSLNDSNVQPGVVETVGGETFASVDVYDNAEVSYKLGGLCTKLTTATDYRGPAAGSVNLAVVKTPTNGGPSTSVNQVLSTGAAPQLVLTSLTAVKYLVYETSNFHSGDKLVLGNPRAYCNAESLPAWEQADLK